MEFSRELVDFVHERKQKPGSLIMMLHRVQEEFGYHPAGGRARSWCRMDLSLPLAKIYGGRHVLPLLQDHEARQAPAWPICLGHGLLPQGRPGPDRGSQSILNIERRTR
ncbi:MAG: hypothetical protein MZV70_10960 [Desulfobacterales bacterium]|nr:hypothetical protein [Desulfobacterales bacterium]